MGPVVRYLFIPLLLAGFAAQAQPLTKSVVAEPISSVVVRVGIRGGKEFTEYRYVVDIAEQRAKPEARHDTSTEQRSDFEQRQTEEWHRNAAIYERIFQQYKTKPDALERYPRLGMALQETERVIKAGYAYRHPIVASSDGSKAVYSWRNTPLLLIDSNDLATRSLEQNDGPTVWPVAWAPDSAAVVLPANDLAIQIYDVRRQTVVARRTGLSGQMTAISWSPDSRYIAVCELTNRRQNKTILGRLAGAAGHPEFWNDAVLHLFRASDDNHFSLVLKREISEWGSPDFRVEWH